MKDGGVEKMDVDDDASVEIEEFSDKSSLEIDEDFRDFDAEEAKVSDTIPISSPDEVATKMGRLSTREAAQQRASQVQETQEVAETPQATQITEEISETQRSSQKVNSQKLSQNPQKLSQIVDTQNLSPKSN